MAFNGFSTNRLVGLPPELFTQVLPAISLPSELKVTLHTFYRLSQQRQIPRRIRWDDLADDTLLQQSLRSISNLRPTTDLLEEGLHAALQRATLLHLALPGAGRTEDWYLANTEANREWVAYVHDTQPVLPPNEPASEPRPSLVTLYEQNIGLVTPLLLEELREAEEHYPRAWIEEALREAVRSNARSWRYVRKVLERWATHGRHHAPNQSERPIDTEKYVTGPNRHLFRSSGEQHNHDDE
jgi:DnaD/phage-associated family protein